MRHHYSHVLAGPHARGCRSTTQVASRFGDESEEEVGDAPCAAGGSAIVTARAWSEKTYEPTVWVMAVGVMAVCCNPGEGSGFWLAT